MKGQFVRANIKQKVRTKIQQKDLDILSNQIFLESIDYLFQFIQIKMPILNDLKIENITYQKELFKIITPPSMEKPFMTKPLIPI